MGGIRIEFFLFALTLLGVALFHHKTLQIAVGGMVAISLYKTFFVEGFDIGHQFAHEWSILTNLFGLLVGFALLAEFFKESRIPELLPRYLPDDWKGGFVLLCLVWILSSFLDNIAAAMIGGTVAGVVFNKKVHIGFLAAIVAASNAGGAWSVVGDTTTTMMWIGGKSPADVFHAIVPAAVALLGFGIIAAKQQDRHQRIQKDASSSVKIDGVYVGIVALILTFAIAMNTAATKFGWDLPAAAIGVWAAILIGALMRKPAWHEVPGAVKGSIFLLSLVMCASMMPVEELPAASWQTAFGLGFVSAVFDNIPLTALALKQGGYDWGGLAYAVGFGGSMIWFGSSAGVALSNMYAEAKSVGQWLKHGWHVTLGYVLGFVVYMLVLGWHAHEIH
ncbi:MAG: citrate transporter [Planctomycetes bacterium]|nr:citrate transporter [Planctomycetota bacterium]MCC7171813.1 citrate transporter [Planctomycetota bacterium]